MLRIPVVSDSTLRLNNRIDYRTNRRKLCISRVAFSRVGERLLRSRRNTKPRWLVDRHPYESFLPSQSPFVPVVKADRECKQSKTRYLSYVDRRQDWHTPRAWNGSDVWGGDDWRVPRGRQINIWGICRRGRRRHRETYRLFTSSVKKDFSQSPYAERTRVNCGGRGC